MKSAILYQSNDYIHVSKAFCAINNNQPILADYNWLVTDIDCYSNDNSADELFGQKYVWLPYQELMLALQRSNMFLWGVFSGFPKHITLEQVLSYDLPFADGNTAFWVDDVQIQHPLAEVEIVAFDASYTIVISKHDEQIDRFRQAFPLSQDLQARNRRENTEIAHIEQLLIQELTARNLPINEMTLHVKYGIWHNLYLDKNHKITDENIFRCICTTLSESKMSF